MIPSPGALEQAYAALAPELGAGDRVSAAALRIALQEADHLADDVYDVPAALLFAFGRYPRCFSAFRAMSVLVVEWHTKALGFKLEASRPALEEVLVEVAARRLPFEDVRSWVAERMLPFGG